MHQLFCITETWKSSAEDKHKSLSELFSRIFRVTSDGSRMIIPDVLRQKALTEWMEGDETLVNMLEFQEVTSICNLVTLDTNIYNPLRVIRPNAEAGKSDYKLVEKLAESSSQQCDLCHYKECTAEDIFGRLETELAYTVSNAFKFDAWHSMVAFRTHHPVKWTQAELSDSFDLMLQWFQKVHRLSPIHQYPIIFWDMLPPSGASQVHPHIHMVLARDQYHGELERWHRSAQQYKKKYHSDYWTDLLQVSSALGLTVPLGDATAAVNLTPKMGHEVILHSEQPSVFMWKLLYYTIQTYSTKLCQYSFSMAMVLPPLGCCPDPSQPAFARIVPRGSMNSHKSNISCLELFASPAVSVDPLETASLLRATLTEGLIAEESSVIGLSCNSEVKNCTHV